MSGSWNPRGQRYPQLRCTSTESMRPVPFILPEGGEKSGEETLAKPKASKQRCKSVIRSFVIRGHPGLLFKLWIGIEPLPLTRSGLNADLFQDNEEDEHASYPQFSEDRRRFPVEDCRVYLVASRSSYTSKFRA